MKTLANSRQIDPLGRVVLPKDMRRALNLHENDLLDIVLEGNAIVLTKSTCSCALCGRTENLTAVGKGYICPACREQIIHEAE